LQTQAQAELTMNFRLMIGTYFRNGHQFTGCAAPMAPSKSFVIVANSLNMGSPSSYVRPKQTVLKRFSELSKTSGCGLTRPVCKY